MRTIFKLITILSLGLVLLPGCKTVAETVRPVTKPVGGVAAVPQAITQGVAEGYVEQTGDSTTNPYGR